MKFMKTIIDFALGKHINQIAEATKGISERIDKLEATIDSDPRWMLERKETGKGIVKKFKCECKEESKNHV